MLTITFEKTGTVINDFEAREWCDNKLQEYLSQPLGERNMKVSVGTENLFLAFQLAEVEHRISGWDIEYYYNGVKLFHNDCLGADQIENPIEVPSFWGEVTDKILRASAKNLRRQRQRGGGY